MDMTISLKDAGLIILFIALIVLVVYAIVLVKNLITTIKSTNKILADTKVITEVAQRRTTDVDNVMDNVISSVSGISGALRGEEKMVQSVSSVAKAVSSLVGVFKKKKDD